MSSALDISGKAMAPILNDSKPKLKQLDGMRGLLCIGVIAINCNLYNTGANTLVGFFLIQSGLTAYLAYGDKTWDDEFRLSFFKRRSIRLLPMLIVSSFWQLFCSAFHIEIKDGEGFFGNVFSLIFLLSPLCCIPCMYRNLITFLVLMWCGSLTNGPGWYVAALLVLSVYFLPKLLAKYGEKWASAPPSWGLLLIFALAEGLQYGIALVAYYLTNKNENVWYWVTAAIYLGLPPLCRLVTFLFGLHIGRWAKFEVKVDRSAEPVWLKEARTLVPMLATFLVVFFMHGAFISEYHSHDPYPASPLLWSAVHMIHPFNVLAIICGLVMAPESMVSKLLASKPLLVLADLSYAMYLLHWGVITLYVVFTDKQWISIHGNPFGDDDFESEITVPDFFLVVAITTGISFPVTKWVEPAVRAWVKKRIGEGPQPSAGEV